MGWFSRKKKERKDFYVPDVPNCVYGIMDVPNGANVYVMPLKEYAEGHSYMEFRELCNLYDEDWCQEVAARLAQIGLYEYASIAQKAIMDK